MSPGDRSADTIVYRKLPGDFRGFFRRSTLWLSPDHLLLVDSSRFSETYKRFYLRDIQNIIVRKTPRFVVPYYWLVIAVAALIALLASMTPFRQGVFFPAVAVLGGVTLYLYIASMFESCTCHLVTRVNRVELTSLFRLSSARQFVDVISPQISAAQGPMPEGWVERTTTLAELTTANPYPGMPVELLPASTFSWITVAVFVFVLIDAGLTWMQLRLPDSRSLSVPNVVNMIALAISATISIVLLSRQKGGWALRVLVLGGLFVVAAVTYAAVLLQSFDQQIYRRSFQSVLDYPGMRILGIGEIAADAAVAIPGLILAFRQSPLRPSRSSRKATSILDAGAPQA